ncbi:hypothetical protein KGQ19_15885 [Catenulispora sp. NL8]|uniref:Uncharacterized protein n=1 Tax=Catenulispora pinistramenti TaxID=2705254 RepID=A0ABS5KQP3_9ACTN|nr:hypothetical protein [Catenulispora pinistramenti]MBS2548346.1 hypothetical protein [Catenulispora pinistramenti]
MLQLLCHHVGVGSGPVHVLGNDGVEAPVYIINELSASHAQVDGLGHGVGQAQQIASFGKARRRIGVGLVLAGDHRRGEVLEDATGSFHVEELLLCRGSAVGHGHHVSVVLDAHRVRVLRV